jgi:hypothetical protein
MQNAKKRTEQLAFVGTALLLLVIMLIALSQCLLVGAWGSAPDWVQAIGVVVGIFFAVYQLKQEALANRSTAFLAIAELMQSEKVREARKGVRVAKKRAEYPTWKEEEKEFAQLVATSFDVAGAALRYGAFDLRQFGIVWRNTVLELAPLIDPHVEVRRQESVELGLPAEGAFENYRWLVDEMKKLN